MKNINYSLIGKNIKIFRESHYLSQFQLAELCGLSQVYISNIETGKKNISLKSLIKISNVLNVSCDDLLGNNILKNNDILNKQYSNTELNILNKFLLDIQQNLFNSSFINK